MNSLHLRLLLIATTVFVNIPMFCQIEHPVLVDRIIKEGDLGELYAEFPNAMKLYKESKSLKTKGVLLEILGISAAATGGYFLCKGILLNLGMPNSPHFGKVGYTAGGAILGLVGIAITRSGGRTLDLSVDVRRGSAQQYIWDLQSRTAIEKKEQSLGVLSIGLHENGLGLTYTF